MYDVCQSFSSLAPNVISLILLHISYITPNLFFLKNTIQFHDVSELFVLLLALAGIYFFPVSFLVKSFSCFQSQIQCDLLTYFPRKKILSPLFTMLFTFTHTSTTVVMTLHYCLDYDLLKDKTVFYSIFNLSS